MASTRMPALCSRRHESYQTFSITAETVFFSLPATLCLMNQQQWGIGLCHNRREQEKMFSLLRCEKLSMSKLFCVTFTPTSPKLEAKQANCSQFLMLQTTLFDNCQFRSNRELFDETTGNMQNLSSIEQTFLVSLMIIEQQSFNRHPSNPNHPRLLRPEDMFRKFHQN